jgi:predicted ATPase
LASWATPIPLPNLWRQGVDVDLLERDTELAVIEDLIGAAAGGGRLLAIEGPPGIGKTSLVAETKARGEGAGMDVLGARGSELERAFSYGVVRQLFEPFLAGLPEDERSELLAGAASLATPVLDPAWLTAAPATADVSLATLHGLYWLVASLAARRPLLLAIDDLHWCDLPSLRLMAYVLPRMEGSAYWSSSASDRATRETIRASWARSSPTRSPP